MPPYVVIPLILSESIDVCENNPVFLEVFPLSPFSAENMKAFISLAETTPFTEKEAVDVWKLMVSRNLSAREAYSEIKKSP